MPFNTGSYTSGMFSKPDNSNPGSAYAITVTPVAVTSGVDISITVQNLTTGNQQALKVRFDVGWGVSGVAAAPTGIFLADISWKNGVVGTQYVNPLRNDLWGTSFFSTGVDAAAGINIPCSVLHAGDRAIGIATNYPYIHEFAATMLSGTSYGWYSVGDQSFTTADGVEKSNDFYASGESRSWSIWLRESSGVAITTGQALSLIQPYTDWFTARWPNQRPPVVSGRIYGVFMAQTETSGNPRSYNIVSGIYASSGNVDWNTILDTYCPPPATLRSKGYNGFMMWNLAGHRPADQFPMNIYQAMPDNLKGKLHQVKDWSIANQIDVYTYIGVSYLYYQPHGNWNDDFFHVTSGFNSIVGSGYALATDKRHVMSASGQRISKINIEDGCMVWFDGVGLDAMPDTVIRPFMTGVLQSIRDNRPNKLVIGEAYKSPMTQSYIPCAYYPPTQWDGLRCSWMDTVFPNYQNFAIINSSEFANTGVFAAEVARCEAAGLCVITLVSSAAFTAMSAQTYPKIALKDVKAQIARPRGVR